MFNLALSSLHLRGGADHAQAALSILLDFMPAMGVAPDVVARCVVTDACARAGDAEAAAAVLADARDAAGAGKRSKSKEKKKKKKTKRKATAGPVEALGVLWEDDGLAAVRKPAGWLTHGTDGKRGDEPTLVDALLDRFGDEGLSSINPNGRGIVHRLDRPTSGVMIVAKTDASHAALVTAWFQRRVQKTYVALAEGHPGDKAMRGRERRQSEDEDGDRDGDGDGTGTGMDLGADEKDRARGADGRPAGATGACSRRLGWAPQRRRRWWRYDREPGESIRCVNTSVSCWTRRWSGTRSIARERRRGRRPRRRRRWQPPAGSPGLSFTFTHRRSS